LRYTKANLTTWLALACMLNATLVHATSVGTDRFTRHTGSGDPVTGKTRSQVCQGCHGIDGNSKDGLIPKLAGQYDVYIVKEMHNYQTGLRSHEIMNGMAATLGDQALADIAAYFSDQPIMAGSASAPNDRGKTLYLNGNISEMVMACVNCHGNGGKGLDASTAMYPVIGGQHKAYLLKQLRDFRADDRVNSPNVIMNKIVRSLSDDDLEAIADYLSSQ
jgi:cytochrome c553